MPGERLEGFDNNGEEGDPGRANQKADVERFVRFTCGNVSFPQSRTTFARLLMYAKVAQMIN